LDIQNGTPMQIIDAPLPVVLQRLDLSHLPLSEAQSTARSAANQLVTDPIDLCVGPLFTMFLIKLAPDDHVLVLAADHLFSDARSLEIVNQELWTAYRQLARNQPVCLPPLRVQFADYALWQHALYPRWERLHAGYWREKLMTAPPMHIPADFQPATDDDRTDAMAYVPFGKQLSADLRAVAEREHIRVPLVLLALHACTMARWCRQNDVLLLFVTHGRQQDPALATMVGLLATALHFRLQIREHDSLLDLLMQVREEFDTSFERYDFDWASELVPGARTDVCFNWISTPPSSGKTRPPETGAESPRLQQFQLGMAWRGKFWPFFTDTPAGLNVRIAYRSNLLAASTIERFGRHLRAYARGLVAWPHAPIGSLAIDVSDDTRTAAIASSPIVDPSALIR